LQFETSPHADIDPSIAKRIAILIGFIILITYFMWGALR
jgi:preprotein translocase subunit Sec61beta